MATLAELQQRLREKEAEEIRLQAEYKSFTTRIESVFAQERPLEVELRRQRGIIQDPNASQAQKDAALDRALELEQELRVLENQTRQLRDQQNAVLKNQLEPVQREIYGPGGLQSQVQQAETEQRAQANQGPKTDSAGSIAAGASAAQVENANATNPPLPPPTLGGTTGSISNAETFSVNEDSPPGATRPLSSTQTIPPPTAQTPASRAAAAATPGSDPSSLNPPGTLGPTGATSSPVPGSARAAASASDDADQPNDVIQLVDRLDRLVTPQDNILDQFSSYTYSFSLYLMTAESYSALLKSKQRTLAGSQLLIQSGGAPLAPARNQFFPLDYYIDDVEVTSICPGKGSGGAHNVTEMKFKITEPNGITLLKNLYAACDLYADATSTVPTETGAGAAQVRRNTNYASQNYLMVIRFYGYDANGNLLTPSTIATTTSGSLGYERTDSNAIVEKFIPFQLSAIKFRIANRLTEYYCETVAPQNIVATGQARGVIPYNIEMPATTLQNLLNGNARFTEQRATEGDGRENTKTTTGTAPDKATAAPDVTLTQGLEQALNKYQQELQAKGVIEQPDIYKIVISHPELANGSIVPPGNNDRSSKPSVQPTSGSQAKDADKVAVKNDARIVSATAGTSIVQFLDQVVQRSDYIFKQQTKIKAKDPRTGKEVDVPQGGRDRAFAWYRIGVQARPTGKFDKKRNDESYEITYEIAPYLVNQVKSDYFPNGRFRGVQKRYAYWFTGENTSIINFEQDFNYLYYITINGPTSASFDGTSNYREVERRAFSPNSAQSNQGIKNNVFEPVANAADYLYSPGDQGRVNLTIIGDPAWIAQGEVWSGVRSTQTQENSDDAQDPFSAPFLPDGTINYDAREVLFEVAWNTPADYDLGTGTINLDRGV